MAFDYAKLGLNGRLQAITSPSTRRQKVNAFDFDSKYSVRSSNLITSKLSVAELYKRNGVTSATADFSSDATLNITSTSYFNPPNRFQPFVGIPYTSIYEGTVIDTDHEIYPIEGTAVTGDYTVTQGFDWQAWQGTTSTVYRTQITNNGGTSSQVFSYYIDIIYLDYVIGTTS